MHKTAALARLRADLVDLDVAARTDDPERASAHMPREYPDEAGSDPSVGIRGAHALLTGADGYRAIVTVGDGPLKPLGPGDIRRIARDRETRWPEVEGPPNSTVAEIRASIAEVADAAAADGISIWAVVVNGDDAACLGVRGDGTCRRVRAEGLSAALAEVAAEIEAAGR